MSSKQQSKIIDNGLSKTQKKALQKMQSSKILDYIVEEVHKEGVVNEDTNIKLLTIKLMLKYVKNRDPVSSNVLITEETGAGKDWLVENTLKVLIPEADIVMRTGLTNQSLNYWFTNKKYSNGWTFDGKILYLSDPPEDTLKGDGFRTLATGKNHYSTVVKGKMVDIKIKGKPVIVVTSMKNNIDVEGQRRWDAIHADNSNETTVGCLENIFGLGKNLPEPDTSFRNQIQTLLEYNVLIPFKPALGQALLNDNKKSNKPTILRTKVKVLLDFIRASAILHQHNRKIDDDGNLIAELEDYEIAKKIFMQFQGDSGQALDTYERAVKDALIGETEGLSVQEIAERVGHRGVTENWFYRHRDNMMEKHFIKQGVPRTYEAGENSKGEPFKRTMKTYKLVDYSLIKLPTSEKVRKIWEK